MVMESPRPQEYVKFWHEPELDGLELLHAHYITHTFAPHAHEGYAIGVIESGGQAFTYKRANHLVMPANTIAAVNPDIVHSGKSATPQGWIYRMFYPSPTLLQRAAAEIAGRPRDVPFFANIVIDDPFLWHRIRHLHQLIEDPTTTRLERDSRFLWTFAQLIVRHADSPHTLQPATDEPIAVKMAREFLDAHYAENISLDQLAALVNLSPFHLLRLFRHSVGLPPHAYHIQARLTRARHLLLTDTPIVDIALQTGFVDQAHLNRHFKRALGVSPGQYRLQP